MIWEIGSYEKRVDSARLLIYYKNMFRKIGVFLLGIVGIASIALKIYLIKTRPTSLPTNNIILQQFNVASVIDGDTFKISDGRRVRLMGIDTPELRRCLADEAKEKLTTLILGKNVILKDQFSDSYGRIMANVFVGDDYINKEMICSGLARMDYYENPHRGELKIAYAQARENKLGIFSGICTSLNPPVSCTIKVRVHGL